MISNKLIASVIKKNKKKLNTGFKTNIEGFKTNIEGFKIL